MTTPPRTVRESLQSEEPGDPPVALTGHLAELRRRLAVCLGVVVLAAGIGFGMADRIIGWLKQPAGELVERLAFFSPPEALLAHMKVALVSGIVLALPLVLYEVWAFIRPGLRRQERTYGGVFVWCGTGLFGAGVAFAYWVLLPTFLKFLLTFGTENLQPVLSINRYLSFVLTILISCGVVLRMSSR